MNTHVKGEIIAYAILLYALTAFSIDPPAQLYTNTDLRFQTIEGFGGGLVFRTFPYNHPKKDELYDSIFNNAGINIIRIGNWYDPAVDSEVTEIPMMLEIQAKWPHVKTMLTSWSPPPYLKTNSSLTGENNATLKKNSDSTYMYEEYADYWLKSIQHFKSKGVRFDWLSIQNEPDWSPDYEGCVLNHTETEALASYGKALNAVYTKCNIENDEQIIFTGPDVCGVGLEKMLQYVSSPEFNKDQIVSYAHHYYDYSGVPWMEWAGYEFADKPIFQTEFLVNEDVEWGGIIRNWHFHAEVILHHLVLEKATMYLLFALTYRPASTHCMFSIDTLGNDWYEARPTWYMFKHFSRSIHRGWQRIGAASSDSTILVSAFANEANDSGAIVVINTAPTPKSIHFVQPEMVGDMYQTTDSIKYAHIAALTSEETVNLPVKSITTFDFHKAQVPIIAERAVKASPSNPAIMFTGSVIGTRGGAILTEFSGSSTPVTLSLYDIKGNLIATIRTAGRDSPIRHHMVLARRVTPGTYIVVFKNATTSLVKNCTIAY